MSTGSEETPVSPGTFTALSPFERHVGDVDVTHESVHHTLGKGPTQAAAGNHSHRYDELSQLPPEEQVVHKNLAGLTTGDDHTQYTLREPTTVTDWNNAIKTGFYKASGAANSPFAKNGWWMGWVVRYSDSYVNQYLTAFAQNGMEGVFAVRQKQNGVWNGWYRLAAYIASWDNTDAFQYYQHGGNSASGSVSGINRFAIGNKKDQATNAASVNDEFRIQCYDLAGDYTFNAMMVTTGGVVNFPKGHSLLAQALLSGETVNADRAATIGMVDQMITARATEIASNMVNDLRLELGLPVRRSPVEASEFLLIGPPSATGDADERS